MIKLLQLELQNFLSHVDTKLDLTSHEGLVLIEGKSYDGHYSSNGAGKSTLLEGIVYALTGDTLRGVGVNDVVNRNYKKNTRVTLRFMKDDILYEISRYRKDDIMGDSIVFKKNDEDISKRVNKETQQLIDNTLGISYKILVSTMLLGEGLSSKFTQLSDPEKKSLIESTLNLSYEMSDIRAKANTKLGQYKIDKATLDGKISSLKEYSNYDVESAESQIKSLLDEYASCNRGVDLSTEESKELRTQSQTLIDKMSLLKTSIDNIDNLNLNLRNKATERDRLMDELKNLEQCADPLCTLCHQKLSSKESKEAVHSNYKERIANLMDDITDITSQISSLPNRNVLVETYDKFNKQVSDINHKLQDINSRQMALGNKAYQCKSDAERLQRDIDIYNEAQSDITTLESESIQLSKDVSMYDYFYKLFAPTGIIIDILSEAIGYINTRLSTYSEVLLEKDYHIEFVKGKISLVDSKGSSYQSLSNGEKRRLDISIQFALHDYVTMYCGLKMDTCFIDEILDTLDDVGVMNIFEVLRLKLDYCGLQSVYVITHNDELKDKFDQIITVKKNEKGDSVLV